VVQASELSLDDVLQHLLVQREVRHQLAKPQVLLLELLQPFHLRRHQPAVLRSPAIVGLDRYSGLTTDLLHRRTFLRLPQDEGDLLLTEPRSSHANLPVAPPSAKPGKFS